MPDGVLILRPSAAGDLTRLLGYPGGEHFPLVAQDSYNDLRFVYYAKVGGSFDQSELYRWPMPHPRLGTITYIQHFATAKRDAYSTAYSLLRIGSTDYSEAWPLFGGGIEQASVTYAVDPSTGLAWQWSDLVPTRTQFGIRLTAVQIGSGQGEVILDPVGGGGEPGTYADIRCYQTWLAVGYWSDDAVGAIPVRRSLGGLLT